MKKNIFSMLLMSALFYLINPSSSFSQAFSNEAICISGGYGAGTFFNSYIVLSSAVNGNIHSSQAGPLYLKAEKAVSDHVGFAINFAYLYNQWSYLNQYTNSSGAAVNYTSTQSRASYSIMGRVNFHFGSNKKFDPYFGFGMGYRNAIWKTITNDPTNPLGDAGVTIPFPFAFETTLGAKYLVTPNFGIYAEFGAAKSVFQAGLVLNLPGNNNQ